MNSIKKYLGYKILIYLLCYLDKLFIVIQKKKKSLIWLIKKKNRLLPGKKLFITGILICTLTGTINRLFKQIIGVFLVKLENIHNFFIEIFV